MPPAIELRSGKDTGMIRKIGCYSRVQAFFERHLFSSRKRFFLSLFIPLTLIYGATASWTLP